MMTCSLKNGRFLCCKKKSFHCFIQVIDYPNFFLQRVICVVASSKVSPEYYISSSFRQFFFFRHKIAFTKIIPKITIHKLASGSSSHTFAFYCLNFSILFLRYTRSVKYAFYIQQWEKK